MCWQNTCGYHGMRPKYLKGFFALDFTDFTGKLQVKQGPSCSTNSHSVCPGWCLLPLPWQLQLMGMFTPNSDCHYLALTASVYGLCI